jgi:hypothetical protein
MVNEVCAMEVFDNLKKKRDFNGDILEFNDEDMSGNFTFKSKNINNFLAILDIYGFFTKKETYGVEFDTLLNYKFLKKEKFEQSELKENDFVQVFYKNRACYNLHFHLIIYEIDNVHDDDYHFRKELEK